MNPNFTKVNTMPSQNNNSTVIKSSINNSEEIDIDWNLFPMPGTPGDEAMLQEHEKRNRKDQERYTQWATKPFAHVDRENWQAPTFNDVYDKLRDFYLYGSHRLPTGELNEIKLLEIQMWSQLPERSFERLRKAVLKDLGGVRLKLDIMAYQQESDPAQAVMLKRFIQQQYGISTREFEQISGQYDAATGIQKCKRYKPSEFLQLESEGVKWVIPGLIPSPGVTILGGDPGVGKTTMAYDIAASVLYGDEFLGEAPGQRGKTLFISSDELPSFAQDKMIDRGYSFDDDQWTMLLDWDVTQKLELEKALEDTKPTLTVIDSFASIHKDSTFDENSAQAKQTIYWLEKMAKKYNTAILLIHHANKNQQQKGVSKLRGSSAIAGACSAVLLLEQGKDDCCWLSTPKIRGAAPMTASIKMDGKTGHFILLDKPSADNEEVKSIAQKLLQFFKNNVADRFEFDIIRSKVSASADAIYKALKRLCERGLLIKRPSKRDPRARVWGLPKEMQDELLSNVNDSVHTPPPSPTRSIVSNIISETIDSKGLEDIGQILDKTLDTENCLTSFEPCLETSKPDIQGIPENILDTTLKEGGGESTQVSSVTAEAPELKAGDRVEIRWQDSRFYGHEGKVVSGSDVQANRTRVVVSFQGATYTVDYLTETLIKLTEPQQLSLL